MRVLLRIQPAEGRLAEAIGIVVAFVAPWVSFAMYTVVALIWVVPDQRIERTIAR